MGNIEKKDSDLPGAYYSIYNNNYLLNSYKCLIRSKIIHFLVTLIEILFNIYQELVVFLKGYKPENEEEEKYIKIILYLPEKIRNLSDIIKILIVLLYIIVFDIVYIFLGKIKLKKKNIYFSILYNLLELFFFRLSMLLFLDIFCSLSYIYSLFLILLLIPHLYITVYHFLYNHLYIFVPVFIEYPFDEFSSLFDLYLLIIKILLAAIINTNIVSFRNVLYIIILVFQIYCCIYFFYQLINESYLFMKNLFLNETKIALFFAQTIIIIIAELSGKNAILNISFLVFLISIFIILLCSIFYFYEPMSFFKIKRGASIQNIIFYLFVFSIDTEPLYAIENQIKLHNESCGICDLCKKYIKYLRVKMNYAEIEENENCRLINKTEKRNTDKLINIFFDILYDGKNKYFPLIKDIILIHRNNEHNLFINSSYFYVNLSFLLFSELKDNNYILALNIKIILDVINNINKLLDIHETQIEQIMLCNQFLSLCSSTLKQINNILKTENQRDNKFLELSSSLNDMKNPKYKEILFTHKQDNISNSKNTIFVCSLLYEEIFNTILTSNQIPLRENFQLLEDNFINNSSKIEKVISLALNLTKKHCKIVRAGKDLYCYKDNNLFDLIPLIFKDYFVNDFLYKILEHFNINVNESKRKRSLNYNYNSTTIFNSKKRANLNNKINKKMTLKLNFEAKNKKQIEYIEFKMIICVNISSKLFYRLLILKLSPLFNYDYNNNFILLDGSFYLYKNTLMTLQDTKNPDDATQKIISVSKLELETPPQIYTMKFKKYVYLTEKNNYKITKVFSFWINNKYVSIYSVYPKEKDISKKLKRVSFFFNEPEKTEDDYKNLIGSKNLGKYIEDTASINSQQVSYNNNINLISGLGIKNKKKENIYEESNLYKIRNIYYLLIPIIIIFSIIEILHLSDLKQGDYNNDYSIIYFNEFYKLYFQLFSTILSVVCIQHKNGCRNIMNIYSSKIYGFDYYFNCSRFFEGQNQVLAEEILEGKSKLINIHQHLGSEKYKKIFEEAVPYIRISKTFNDNQIHLSLKNVSVIFTEAILISINSFQLIVNNTSNQPIYLLNKRKEPFLYFDQYEKNAKNLSDYQKEFYEMILNYKIYYEQFTSIYFKLLEAFFEQARRIKIYNYFYLNASYAIILIIMILLFIYMINFEHLIAKIINYINMIINIKEDSFNFNEEFSKKIKNLEIILNIFEENPINAVHNLISSNNRYNKYMSSKNKKILSEKNKSNYKKISGKKNQKNILDEVPNHLKIIKSSNIRKLFISFYYLLFLVILFFLVFSYTLLSLMWKKYYLVKDNLYSLLRKDTELELSFYKAINIYNLMIFDNLTLDDLSQDIFFDSSKKINDGDSLLNSFYDDLYISFNFNVQISILVNNFAGFPYFNLTCENLYEEENDMIEKLSLNSEIKKIGDVKQKILTLCDSSNIDINHEISEVFQYHYQSIRHAIISIKDFSYQGLIEHLNRGQLGSIYLNFNLILIYITDIINVKFHKEECNNLLKVLGNNLTITIFVEIIIYIILISLVLFFYIARLKKKCEQIILLKKVFQICEIHEQ